MLGAAALILASSSVRAQHATSPGANEPALRSHEALTVPTFKQWLELRQVGGAVISPDGRNVAFTVSAPNWKDNRFEEQIWISRAGEPPFQLTVSGKWNNSAPRWSADGQWLGFLSDRGNGRQVYIIRAAGGEARRVTNIKDGVNDFAWSPVAMDVAFTATGPLSKEMTARQKAYGEFTIEGSDFRPARLWITAADTNLSHGDSEACDRSDSTEERADSTPRQCPSSPAARVLTAQHTFSVGDFAWSPDGRQIAFAHTPDPRLSSSGQSDISVLDVASGSTHALVTSPGPDTDPVWSPDGKWILYSTAAGDSTGTYYRNHYLAKIPSTGGATTVLTRAFDEWPSSAEWLPNGIRFMAARGTTQHIFALDPASGATRPLVSTPDVIRGATFSKDGETIAFVGEDATTLPEVYRMRLDGRPEKLTHSTDQISGWAVGTREVVSWKSTDGTRIEGVLIKPTDYDPKRRYPLLVVIHGGPTGISRLTLTGSYVYPIVQFLAKGAVVLMPNYRGSMGYGEKFRSLNVRNLGVGDAWDVLSGVDALIARGIADSARLAAMGWSQGGYISAFLTTTSRRFKAISVGAGISDWMTYYVSTDITPFTRQYLQATPWSDPKIYAKTSPITYIEQARTPTLIQHGELDRRVPTADAYELYRGLDDVGVPVRLIVYKGFGHGINKPKEQLAATWHNWQWFSKYIWGEAVTIPVDTQSVTQPSVTGRR
jgi:dipeptidyl aminopeptidase/acylaminoacyl peptidase